MAECYPLIDSAAYLCKTSLTFSDLADDNKPTTHKAIDIAEEENIVDETNAILVFDHGGDDA